MLTNVANPILYMWLNPTFKKLLIQTFKKAKFPEGSDTHVRLQRDTSKKYRQTTQQTDCVVKVFQFLITNPIFLD
jgi:hypothetical protein